MALGDSLKVGPQDVGFCQHGNATGCGACIEEAEQLERREAYRKRLEVQTVDQPLFSGALSTLSSETHPEHNEDTIGVYEDAVVVFDGAGGHLSGEAASHMARDTFEQKLVEARTMARSEILQAGQELDTRWKEIVESGSLVTEKDAEERARFREIRDREIAAAHTQLEALNIPDEIKREAIAISRALKALSEEIAFAAQALDHGKSDTEREYKGMATTAAGIRVIEARGRRFGICFSVGDSEVYLERASTGAIVRATKSDNALEHLLERGIVPRHAANDLSNPAIRDARFSGVSQLLGQEGAPTPRIMIWELFPRDRFILASDGLTDMDLQERWKETLRNRRGESWSEVAPKLIDGAMEGYFAKEGKRGDDVTVAIGEIKEPAWQRDWDRLLDDELSGEEATTAVTLKAALEQARGEIAQKVLSELQGAPDQSPRVVTERLRERVREEISRRLGRPPRQKAA